MGQKTQREISLLMHPARRRIYSIVCESPGTYFQQIAESLEIPPGTLAWHLKKLEEDGLLGTLKYGGKRIFYPVALRSPEIERIYYAIKGETARKIFLYVLNSPGKMQIEIAQALDLHHDTIRYHLAALEEVKLVELIRHGRTVRVMKGSAAIRLQEGSVNYITDAFVNFLTNKLVDGCLHPEVVQRTSDRLVLRIECPVGEDILMTIDLTDWKLEETLEF